jgi:predicted metal-binding protein
MGGLLTVADGKAKTTPFVTSVTDKKLAADLEVFRLKAIELGAAAAAVIPAGQIVVDERVRLKCTVPRCLRAGETPNCPPNAPDLDIIRKAFARYSWGIVLKTHVQPIETYAPKGGKDKEGRDMTLFFHQETGKIVYEIEKLAYSYGYYLAMGLGGGSCKDYLCGGLICQFLDSGRCRFPHRSRPAMEAMGINVFDIINKVGWDAYPLIDELNNIPCATSVGMVLVY